MWPPLFQIPLPLLWDLLTTGLLEILVLLLKQLPLWLALWICLHLDLILASLCFSGAALLLLSENSRPK